MESVPGDLHSILGPNERVLLYVRQRIYHPKINIDSVVITNERIILRHPHSLGIRKDYTDYNYQDISNVVLEKGIVRSTIRWTLRFGGDPLSLNDLPNSDAQKAYGIIRENLVRFQAPFTSVAVGMPPFGQASWAAPSTTVTCPMCGARVPPAYRFCGECGGPIH